MHNSLQDLIDGTQNIDVFVHVSGLVKSCAISMSKIANDLRLMSSGPTCGFAEIKATGDQEEIERAYLNLQKLTADIQLLRIKKKKSEGK